MSSREKTLRPRRATKLIRSLERAVSEPDAPSRNRGLDRVAETYFGDRTAFE